MSKYYIGVDLGGTKILTAIADEKGEILVRKKLSTEADKGADIIIENINKTIVSVLEESGISKDEVVRIGIGSPGPLNTRDGIIYENANLPWKNVPIVELLEEKTGLSVKLENDANAAALGENRFGAGKDTETMVYVTVSTGIGGGVIINDKIFHGVTDGAGEIGHMTIEPEGPVCGCGNHGCFEALASGTAIGRRGKEAVQKGQSEILQELSNGDPDNVDAILVAQAAAKGDKIAQDIYNKAGYYLGIGLANLINLFNPELILLGGGVSKDEELFREAMKETLEKRALASSLAGVEIKRAELGDDTGVKGAIAVAMA